MSRTPLKSEVVKYLDEEARKALPNCSKTNPRAYRNLHEIASALQTRNVPVGSIQSVCRCLTALLSENKIRRWVNYSSWESRNRYYGSLLLPEVKEEDMEREMIEAQVLSYKLS